MTRSADFDGFAAILSDLAGDTERKADHAQLRGENLLKNAQKVRNKIRRTRREHLAEAEFEAAAIYRKQAQALRAGAAELAP